MLSEKIALKWLEQSPKDPTGITWGVPWSLGELDRSEAIMLENDQGQALPLQSWPLAYWPDGSVKWSGHGAVIGPDCTSGLYIRKGKAELLEPELIIHETETAITVDTGKISVQINKQGSKVIKEIHMEDHIICSGSQLICITEESEGPLGQRISKEKLFESHITKAVIEQKGDLRSVIRVDGIHKTQNHQSQWLPFSLRFYFYAGTDTIRMTHSFIYDTAEELQYIKGLGIVFTVPMSGPSYNRQVRIGGDTGLFSEAGQSISRRHEAYNDLYQRQVRGEMLEPYMDKVGQKTDMVHDMAVWNNFKLVQDSSEHYVIRKNVKEGCAYIDADHGKRSGGLIYGGSEQGGLAVGLKDFWQKYPSTLEVCDLCSDEAQIKVWFWSPEAEVMDLRHYDTETHVYASYEGSEELDSTPYGIGNRNELTIGCFGTPPEHANLDALMMTTQKPSLLICEPEHYYDTKVFEPWSLRDTSTKNKAYIEEQLDAALDFYIKEVEQRKWYGFWNYGDFMHTYDAYRHVWKYDVGGYAWQNTELAPNMWLWLSFLRTGRSDVFRLAEAMTMHTSEVDVYHIGPYQGLGSRHNVSHWGCGAKEARIGMAGLHRYYYYLTGDERLGDVFNEVKDSDFSTLNKDPMREYYPKDQYPTHARSGPDWAAFSSNWFTRWERYEDTDYRDKLMVGIQSLMGMPNRMLSGSCFGYDPKDGKLYYMGEDTYGFHLAICMGEPQVWMEMVSCLPNDDLKNMLIEFGDFYYLSREEKVSRTSETISDDWDWPMFATGIAAYAAKNNQDKQLADKVWHLLLEDLKNRHMNLPIKTVDVNIPGYIKPIKEIPSITTNVTSQWCLNAIVCLELIGDYMEE